MTIEEIEQRVYELARELNVPDRELERVDVAMAELFAVLQVVNR